MSDAYLLPLRNRLENEKLVVVLAPGTGAGIGNRHLILRKDKRKEARRLKSMQISLSLLFRWREMD